MDSGSAARFTTIPGTAGTSQTGPAKDSPPVVDINCAACSAVVQFASRSATFQAASPPDEPYRPARSGFSGESPSAARLAGIATRSAPKNHADATAKVKTLRRRSVDTNSIVRPNVAA